MDRTIKPRDISYIIEASVTVRRLIANYVPQGEERRKAIAALDRLDLLARGYRSRPQ